ncbi:hypothetical protein [Propionivibrio sp.]|uniref:hypothetical protein n=1 Tax=Propionivibrio sp. TaxID=2212460 RepID=UPI0039E69337
MAKATTRAAQSKSPRAEAQNQDSQKLLLDVENSVLIADSDMKAVLAILNAAEILCALERSPEHQDTHPSHDIKTGGGYAHGRRLWNDTLPDLLKHAHGLANMAIDEYGVVNEKLVEALKGGAA